MDRKLTQDVIDRRDARRSLVSSADRGEKIRTYNYPQVSGQLSSLPSCSDICLPKDRVTDHRIGMSIMNLSAVMEGGGLRDFFEALEHRHYHDQLEDVLQT